MLEDPGRRRRTFSDRRKPVGPERENDPPGAALIPGLGHRQPMRMVKTTKADHLIDHSSANQERSAD